MSIKIFLAITNEKASFYRISSFTHQAQPLCHQNHRSLFISSNGVTYYLLPRPLRAQLTSPEDPHGFAGKFGGKSSGLVSKQRIVFVLDFQVIWFVDKSTRQQDKKGFMAHTENENCPAQQGPSFISDGLCVIMNQPGRTY